MVLVSYDLVHKKGNFICCAWAVVPTLTVVVRL